MYTRDLRSLTGRALLLPILFVLSASLSSTLQAEKKPIPDNAASAIFAGGCFWCMEPPYEKQDGVYEAVSGYIGGKAENAIYEKVASGSTQHYEAVKVYYNPEKISYQKLVDIFWRQIDPTDAGGSFVDRGPQYRSAIFYSNDKEKQIAEAAKKSLEESGKFKKAIATKVLKADTFYKAEAYHQDYYQTHSARYKFYRVRSGRDQFIEKHWKTDEPKTKAAKNAFPEKAERLKQLTPLQYRVTQKDDTERPFDNEYWDNKKDGIYVDIVSGEALFSSTHKYASGTGWPSFYETIAKDNIIEKTDTSFFMTRTEVRSKKADSHLGHLFNDGPEPTGLRYCINSAALKFIPVDEMQSEGYGEYLHLFNKSKP